MEFVRNHRSGVTFAALSLLCVITLSFSTTQAVLRPRELGISLFSTVQTAILSVADGVTNTVNSVRELGELRREHDALLDRLANYQTIEQDVVALRGEIDRLNRVLGYSERLQYENLPARVIGKDPGNLFATITINRGRRDGVRENMAVVAVRDGRQGLVGRVRTVSSSSAQVMPLFDASHFAAARLERSRHEGLVQGGGLGSDFAVMRYVQAQARNEIQYGDLVITSGMASVYPPGIPIGTVETIQAQPYDTTVELRLQPLVDFSRIEHVFVVMIDP
ncbi:MAG: rod shape-determining protein MreC [Spirochaetaceae bacterium]|nr:MAG: rod shape-determining protein MreC [Spirochaetaceae bacterium]